MADIAANLIIPADRREVIVAWRKGAKVSLAIIAVEGTKEGRTLSVVTVFMKDDEHARKRAR